MTTHPTFKLVWRVAERPSGPYRSFQSRGWPSATYANSNGRMAAYIYCAEHEYDAKLAKTGENLNLRLQVADYSVSPWQWRQAKARFSTLSEAKAAAITLLTNNPIMVPKEL